MMQRLTRIEFLITSVTLGLVALASATGVARPLGIALGGGAALLDFALIRRLAAAALRRRPAPSWVMPMALVKSLVLLAVPALALLLPPSVVDGVSFAIGVTALPAAVVLEACLPVARRRAL
jgi:hypothetical protein